MTAREIIEKIHALSIDDRLVVLEALITDLHEAFAASEDVQAEKVCGLLADGTQVSDEELGNGRDDYLINKYV